MIHEELTGRLKREGVSAGEIRRFFGDKISENKKSTKKFDRKSFRPIPELFFRPFPEG
jgi:hypothetical protein